ncbi:hypothetical protein CWO91_36830 [Bradyrhizobium genosp. SA-3]|uniref:hypothetical protein n=1 Tax=Bradyrhizobium genosp. SA-3 TaxID=508868 RepID=UPI0010291652|nr:hypothetical protein [Bradyrhizobium genosp. SA-3]RZM98716.1 hypothetical protein CWO91_36830 [Bradyrhizobium genosp. SA-3]
MAGLLDRIADPTLWAEVEERNALVAHLANWAGTTPDNARAWLDANDAQAIETARRILNSEPYTDVPVEHSYH